MYERLAAYKKQFNSTLVPRNHEESDPKLWNWVNQQRTCFRQKSLSRDREQRLKELGFVWSRRTKWEGMFRLLQQYKEKEGHCNVPKTHKEDGRNLGTWLNTQRQSKKKGKLEPGKELELDELGVVWDLASGKWEVMYALLEQYQEREGHCNVPYLHREDGQNLGTWLKKQRHFKQHGVLDPHRETRLADLGITWRIRRARTTSTWEDMFALLQQYHRTNGDCNVRQKHRQNGENLGMWLTIQRHAKRTGKLDPHRGERLENLGVTWDRVTAWEDVFVLLELYKAREGHCDVPHSHREDGQNLGYWLRNQRQAKQNGKLDPIKQEKMEAIGVVWRIRRVRTTNTWDDMYAMLEEYHGRNGHCNVPDKHQQDGEKLGKWLTRQRQSKRSHKLDPKREERLAKLGVVWETRSATRWEDMCGLLEQYNETNGHCKIPNKLREDGQNLGNWLTRQRQNKKNGKLDPDHEKRLTDLGVVWSFR